MCAETPFLQGELSRQECLLTASCLADLWVRASLIPGWLLPGRIPCARVRSSPSLPAPCPARPCLCAIDAEAVALCSYLVLCLA